VQFHHRLTALFAEVINGFKGSAIGTAELAETLLDSTLERDVEPLCPRI